MYIDAKKLHSYVILGLTTLGIFLPSSLDGQNTLGVFYVGTSSILATMILVSTFKRFDIIRSFLVIGIVTFLIVNTFFSEYHRYQPGTLLVIFPVLLYMSMDLKGPNIKPLITFLNFISISLFVFAMGVVFDISPIQNFLSRYYVTTFTELYKYMLAAHRPVGPFGSHSIAAFMYYLFFVMYYVLWLRLRKVVYLLFSVMYIVLILNLHSNSALFFTMFAVLTAINTPFLLKKIGFTFFFLNILILTMTFTLANGFVDVFSLISGTDTNGLLSRYGPNGVLQDNIRYLKENFFLGDGIAYTEKLRYTDSGYIRNVLTYGVIGTTMFYIAFLLSLFKDNRAYVFIIFVAFMFFEIGYDMFFYPRTVFILLLLSFFISNFAFYKE